MNIKNASLASFNYSPEFFDSGFRFGLRQKLTVECFDSDITNDEGVAASVDDLNKSLSTKQGADFQPAWTVNGYTLSNAQLVGFSIDPGTWVQGVKYSLEIINFLDGTIEDNLSGEYYAGLDFKDTAKYLLDFSESFSFSTAPNSRDYSHSVTYVFSDGLDSTAFNAMDNKTGLEIAQELANACLKGKRPPFGFASPVLEGMYETYGVNCKRFFSEVYDYAHNSVTFVEKFVGLNEEPGEDYLVNRNTTVQLHEEGIVYVEEAGELDFKCGDVSEASMEAATEAQIELARASPGGRMVSAYAEYKQIIKTAYESETDCVLAELVLADDGGLLLLSNQRTYNLYTEKSTYSIRASNDGNDDDCKHEYKTTIAADQDWFTSTEAGSFVGLDKKIALKDPGGEDTTKIYPAYNKAYNCWNTMWTDPSTPDSRLRGLITSMQGFNSEAQIPSPQYTEDSITHSKTKGSISYRRSFSSHPRYSFNGDKIKSFSLTVREKVPHERKVVEDVINAIDVEGLSGGQVLQDLKGVTLMEKSNEFKLLGTRDASLSHLMGKCLSEAEMGENFLVGAKYGLSDLNDISLNLSLSWN